MVFANAPSAGATRLERYPRMEPRMNATEPEWLVSALRYNGDYCGAATGRWAGGTVWR